MHIPFISKILPIISGSFRLLKGMFTVVATIVIVSTIAFVSIYFYFARDLPEIRTLEDYRPPVISEVFADKGEKVGEFWLECRIYYPYDRIPEQVVQAFLSAEDSRFFEHKGVDMRSIMRAVIANIKAGGVAQGGSTITQQITRSLLLTRERTITRKVKEAILATRLERRLDKKQILTLYLNQIFLGNRSYGVGAAARNYFHKKLEDLSLAQIAIIAGLPTAPNRFSPINNPAKARMRQQFVLRRMVEEGHITREEMEKALQEKFETFVTGIDKEFTDPDAAYFVEHVRRQVKEKYGDEVLYHQGLKIYTTMSVDMQTAAQHAIREGIESADHRRYGWQGALEHVDPSQIDEKAREIGRALSRTQHGNVVFWPPSRDDAPGYSIIIQKGEVYPAVVSSIDGNTVNIRIGDVRGVITSKGYMWTHRSAARALSAGDVILVRARTQGDKEKVTTSAQQFSLTRKPVLQAALFSMNPHNGYVKAMVGGYSFEYSEFNRATQALRQPGSSFKPFVYAAALDKGYTYNTTIIDSPVVFQVGQRSFWSPRNYGGGYKGPTPFQNCLKFSRNVPTVKITFDIGMHYLTGFLRKVGFTTQVDKYLSMALGANVVSLSEMVPAYATFVSHGAYHPAITITKIMDNKGTVLFEITPQEAARPRFPKTPTLTAEEENLEELKFVGAVDTNELSQELFNNQKPWIAKDKLLLTDFEVQTLYGKVIPYGYVMTPQTAHLMTQLLRGVVLGGTGTRLRALGLPSGGKTGTTNDETDAWFMSIMPDLVSGVWVGFDEIKRIGYGATGGNTAAPIVLDYLKRVTKGWEEKEFKAPEGFPSGRIASLTGGSALMGKRMPLAFPGEFGDDLAGAFFESDMEYSGEYDDQPRSFRNTEMPGVDRYRNFRSMEGAPRPIAPGDTGEWGDEDMPVRRSGPAPRVSNIPYRND